MNGRMAAFGVAGAVGLLIPFASAAVDGAATTVPSTAPGSTAVPSGPPKVTQLFSLAVRSQGIGATGDSLLLLTDEGIVPVDAAGKANAAVELAGLPAGVEADSLFMFTVAGQAYLFAPSTCAPIPVDADGKTGAPLAIADGERCRIAEPSNAAPFVVVSTKGQQATVAVVDSLGAAPSKSFEFALPDGTTLGAVVRIEDQVFVVARGSKGATSGLLRIDDVSTAPKLGKSAELRGKGFFRLWLLGGRLALAGLEAVEEIDPATLEHRPPTTPLPAPDPPLAVDWAEKLTVTRLDPADGTKLESASVDFPQRSGGFSVQLFRFAGKIYLVAGTDDASGKETRLFTVE